MPPKSPHPTQGGQIHPKVSPVHPGRSPNSQGGVCVCVCVSLWGGPHRGMSVMLWGSPPQGGQVYPGEGQHILRRPVPPWGVPSPPSWVSPVPAGRVPNCYGGVGGLSLAIRGGVSVTLAGTNHINPGRPGLPRGGQVYPREANSTLRRPGLPRETVYARPGLPTEGLFTPGEARSTTATPRTPRKPGLPTGDQV